MTVALGNLYAQQLTLTTDNITEIISAMTVEEKVSLVVGCGAGWGNPDAKYPGTAGWTAAIPRLGIPSIYFADGPQGVNMAQAREYDTADYSCTFFLSGSTLANSWDTESAQAVGQSIGHELKERGLDVILGPGANLHRNILCGRNQEYFSEDPLLSGKMAAAWIRGAQSEGVAACLKHFAANNQETNRKESDSRVGMRALRELYLKSFEIAVKEGQPKAVMGSYNYLNGVHACENEWLLNDVLRREWDWQGAVFSDWDGVVRQVDAVSAGCDLIEPGTKSDRTALLAALEDGSLSIEDLDRNVRNILELVVKCPSFSGYDYSNDIDRKEHQELLRRIASDSMVLLRNEGNVLPLKPCSVGLYGVSSYDLIPANMGVNGVNNGAYHVSLVQGLREAGFRICTSVLREYTDYIAAEKEKIASAYPSLYKQFFRFPRPEEIIPGNSGSSAAVTAPGALTVDLGMQQTLSAGKLSLGQQAKANDAAILTLSRGTGEAFDRTESDFLLTSSEQMLIDSLSKAYHSLGKPVIVLLNVPAPVETVSWRDKVDAILLVGQPGERAGESITDALTGTVAPSGRLADSWPIRYGNALGDSDFPSGVGQDLKSLVSPRASREGRSLIRNIDYTEYEEGIYVGYRDYVTFGKEVAYPFGFGLSFTTFSYENASVAPADEGFVARVVVRNTGTTTGREVVQLYVSAPSGSMDKPVRELKGFAKTRLLAPGESEMVEIRIPLHDLASWNEKKNRWETAGGIYHFCLGESADEMVTDIAMPLPGQDFIDDFKNPPMVSRPLVWWHWMDGNISKDGIRKDLEWMKRSGIGGFQQFDAGGELIGAMPPMGAKIPYMSAEWEDALRYAMHLADSLGLETSIASAPGWSSTGGPWVKPEDAMKKLTWRVSELSSDGKNMVSIELPPLFPTIGRFLNDGNEEGWTDDVAIVAVRLSEAQQSMKEMGAELSSPWGTFDVEDLSDNDLSTGGDLYPGTDGYAWVEARFPRNETIRSMTLAGGDKREEFGALPPTYRHSLQCSEDGQLWRTVCSIPAGSVTRQTIDIPATEARFFRLIIANPEADDRYASFGMGVPATPSTRITEWSLHRDVKVNHAEEKAGFAAPHDLGDYYTPSSIAPIEDVVDLSGHFKDGHLEWNAPAGRWRIYRFGASLTGKRNHPAPTEATGLEVDKLDSVAWEGYFRKYLDLYNKATGGLQGRYLLLDSYEAQQMTWTPKMKEEFKKRNGYDLVPWLPVLAGDILVSTEASEAFLNDWRRTIGDLFAENYDRLNDIIAEYGMKGRYTEAQENGRVFVGDGMDLKRCAAYPMSAIWMSDTAGGSSIPMARADIRESASTAHIYGQNVVAAESFTTVGVGKRAYTYYPGKMKYTADVAFESGLTRFVIHDSAHQPSDSLRPGAGLMIFGQWFGRHETWAEYARFWIDYLARSSYLLGQGRYVADILWYYGEDTNVTALYGNELPSVPQGYAYDFINPHGLLNLVSVQDGMLVTESGMKYKVLVLGEHCRRMSLRVLRKISALVEEGAIVIGEVPVEPASLSDDVREFNALKDAIWHSGRPNVFSAPLLSVLEQMRVKPDFEPGTPSKISFVHRNMEERDVYWIRNFGTEDIVLKPKFRSSGGTALLMNPEDGSVYAWNSEELPIKKDDALFVVFDRTGVSAPSKTEYAGGNEKALSGTWTVNFDGKEVEFPTLQSYTDSDDPAVRYFSGTTVYKNQFTLTRKDVKNLSALEIDLGDVAVMADVYLNGIPVGVLWHSPFSITATSGWRTGENTLEVRVTNLWPNRIIGVARSELSDTVYMPFPFYTADSQLLPSGLLGPVRVTCLLSQKK